MIPASYILKRQVARQWSRLWHGDILRSMVPAPIYYFADHDRLNSSEVELLSRQLILTPLRLPHDEVLFEVPDTHPLIKAVIAFCTQVDRQIDAYLIGASRAANQFTDVLAHAHFRNDGLADVEFNPNGYRDPNNPKYAENLVAIVWRALAVLSKSPIISNEQVPRTRRPKLTRAGISGFTWHLVDIDPERIRAAVHSNGGTHASPRWHIRRGHWRTLADGRRVFVRSCEVGDPSQGAVFKDYRVVMGEAA